MDQRTRNERPLRRAEVGLGSVFGVVRRLAAPLLILASIFLVGTVGYYFVGLIGGRSWSLLDCAYMTVISLTTVGYGDTLGVSDLLAGRVFTMVLLIIGMGGTLYSVSSLTAFIVEGHLLTAFQERRMIRQIEKLSGHTIICGYGETGTHVVSEHQATATPFVVVDTDLEHLRAMSEEHPNLLYVDGDATRQEVLERAGIGRAANLVATLPTDKDNLYLVVTARYLNPALRIVARASEHDSATKFKVAGASSVISPTYIGGMRIASVVLRPNVVDFLDTMLRADKRARFSEITVEANSSLAGLTIARANVGERFGLLIVAMRRPGEDDFIYSPNGATVLEPGSSLVLIGPLSQLQELRGMATAS